MITPKKPPSGQIRIVPWENQTPITQEEAEARLSQEGYESFCWYDVPGTVYPRHKHTYDECLWILKGTMDFTVDENTTLLNAGDRVYLPAQIAHSVAIPKKTSVTFLVGRKPKLKT